MGTISLKSKPKFSLRLKMVLVNLTLTVIAFSLVILAALNVTGKYLVDKKVSEELTIVDELALSVSSSVQEADAEALYTLLTEKGRQEGARMLILDANGTVWVDTLSELGGVRLGYGEVVDVTSLKMDRSYGFHSVSSSTKRLQEGEWLGYYTSAVTGNTGCIGVVMMVSSLKDLTDSMREIQISLIVFFAVVVVLIVWAMLVFSSVITRPINELNNLMQQTARSGFTARANPKGNDEIAMLGKTFNMMSEKLENMDQMRNDFISSASHELKTPLSAMKILIESLLSQEKPDPSMTRDFLSDIDREIDRLSAIVGDLLTIVRFDSRNEQIQMEIIALDELLFDTLNRLQPVADKAEISVEPFCDEVCYVNADPIKLQQALYNLVDNAIKYTPAGGHVWVKLFTNGGNNVVEIKDDGIGIPKENLPHLFERFYRVDKARSRSTGGTGLGLSIVQSIIRMHGGDIEVDSEDNVGTTFRIFLPQAGDPYEDFVDEEETENETRE